MNGQMDGTTDERKSPCVLQDFVPFGAATQKLEQSEWKDVLTTKNNVIETVARHQKGPQQKLHKDFFF